MENLRKWLQIKTMDLHSPEHWSFDHQGESWCFTHREKQFKEEYTHMPEWSKTLSDTLKQEICVVHYTDTDEAPGLRNHYICFMHDEEDDRVLELRVHYSFDEDWALSYITSAVLDRSTRFVNSSHVFQLNQIKQHFLPLLLQSNEYRLAAVTGSLRIKNENIAAYV